MRLTHTETCQPPSVRSGEVLCCRVFAEGAVLAVLRSAVRDARAERIAITA